MIHSIRRPGHRTGRRAAALAMAGLAAATALTACSSTQSQATQTTASGSSNPSGSSGSSKIPAAAFKDTTGLTPSTVTVGNVSTLYAGLFKGALVGTQAYAAYANSLGGVNGRQIKVDSYDDGYQGGPNKQGTQQVADKDFAAVGGFSLQDSYGGTVLAADPAVPDVTVPLSQAVSDLPNAFSPDPAAVGWQLGPLEYFKSKFPGDVSHAAALVADQPSAIVKWGGEKAAMQSIGYKVVYDQKFDITQTDFTQNVVAMRQAGVKILFVEQMPENYAAAVVKALDQQNFHPQVVFGASTYSERLVPDSGGAAAIDGAYLEQLTSLFLGEDATAIPEVKTFLTWVQNVSPGFHPDLYTLFGWLSAQLFAQGLKAAGPNPTRGSVLQQLGKITSFNGDELIATSNPAGKVPASCYIIAQIVQGKFQRLDDPSTTGSTHGYRCDAPYYYYPPRKK
jgi:ABC-type branched-subunit amino acid transport system substrate-binding protein